MRTWTRRQWLIATGAAALAAAMPRHSVLRAAEPKGQGMTLSIGTYSLTGMTVEQGIALVAELGFDALEISVQPGQAGEPSKLPPERRKQIRALLNAKGLALTSLMENLPPTTDDKAHAASVERMRQAMQLAHDLSPDDPPLVQTILGGGQWEDKKTLFRDRVGDWLQVAKQAGVVLAIKPHRMQAMSRPCEAIWLLGQLGHSPWLRMAYDYGHYIYRDMPLEATVAESLPYTALVVVKDTILEGDKTRFALAGETGTIDYPKLLRLFHDGGYRGDVCCEVSAQIWKQPGYDPAATARTCYQNMAAAFDAAGVPRRHATPVR